MPTKLAIRFKNTYRLDDDKIAVNFQIETTDPIALVAAPDKYTTTISTDGHRVRVETYGHGDLFTTLSHKLDPNDPSNAFDVVAAEALLVEPFVLPVTTSNVEMAACLAHAYIINARPEWG